MNLQIEQTKQTLVQNINNSGLPIGVVLYIMKDLVSDLEKNYSQVVANEYNKQLQEQESVETFTLEKESEEE